MLPISSTLVQLHTVPASPQPDALEDEEEGVNVCTPLHYTAHHWAERLAPSTKVSRQASLTLRDAARALRVMHLIGAADSRVLSPSP